MANFDFDLHKIFVEGETDQVLLQFILEEKLGISFKSDAELNNAVINCKGWTNLGRKMELFDKEDRIANGGINYIIFDADSKINNGGIEKRRNELNKIASQLKVESRIFLLPDDISDGDLEDFYVSCFKKEFSFFKGCWTNMIQCFKAKGDGLNLNFTKSADMVFSYVDLFEAYKEGEYRNTKGKRSYFDKGLWEFDFEHNPNLVKLVAFLSMA